MDTVLLCGGEALRTQHGLERTGAAGVWNEDPGGTPELIGDARRGWNDHEELHRMRAAIVMYPLFENAIRGARGRSIEAHQQAHRRADGPLCRGGRRQPAGDAARGP